jgi:ankyrin repeat protein
MANFRTEADPSAMGPAPSAGDPPPRDLDADPAATSILLSVATLAAHNKYGSDMVRLSWLCRATWADADLTAAVERAAPHAVSPPIDAVRLLVTRTAGGGSIATLAGLHLHGVLDETGVNVPASGGAGSGGGVRRSAPYKFWLERVRVHGSSGVRNSRNGDGIYDAEEELGGAEAHRPVLEFRTGKSIHAEFAVYGSPSRPRVMRYGIQVGEDVNTFPAAWHLSGKLAGKDKWVRLHGIGAVGGVAAPQIPPWGWAWFDVPEAPAGALRLPRLVIAARCGLFGRVIQLIAAGACVNASDTDGVTPLLAAVADDGVISAASGSIVGALVAAGADVNARNANGDTPFKLATHRAVEAELNSEYSDHGALLLNTPLLDAFAVMRQLLSATADLDLQAVDTDGDMPIHAAARADAVDVIRFMISHGVGVDEDSMPFSLPAADAALEEGAHRAAFILLSAGARAGMVVHEHDTLDEQNDAADVTAVLLAMGERTPEKFYGGIGLGVHSRLTAAVTHGAVHSTRMFIAAGADLAARDGYGGAALHWATIGNDGPVVRALISAGAPVDDGLDDGRTPLHLGAERDAVHAVRELVAAGADLNARGGSGGLSALHWAAWESAVGAMRVLVAAGASLEARDDAGGGTPLITAARNSAAGSALELLVSGADPNARMGSGATPIMCAARAGAVDIVFALMAAGADPTVRGAAGQSAAAEAAEGGREVASALAAAGAAEPPSRHV